MNTPKETPLVPKPGFYHHYKHDPDGPANDCAYEVLGVGLDTDNLDNFFVVYRPLYENRLHELGRGFGIYPTETFMVRALDAFMDEATDPRDGGRKRPRYTRITDPGTILELCEVRERMYPTDPAEHARENPAETRAKESDRSIIRSETGYPPPASKAELASFMRRVSREAAKLPAVDPVPGKPAGKWLD